MLTKESMPSPTSKVQARAPNCPVIIVGTHYDDILANLGKLPSNYIESLKTTIRERFIDIADSGKKGLLEVFDTFFVSNKTKFNVKSLFNILYKAAYELKIAGGKVKALEQKFPQILINFDDMALKGYVFLDAQWLFDALSRLVTMKEVIANYGIMEIAVFMKLTAKLCNQWLNKDKTIMKTRFKVD
uniref:Origin recognition complex subunit 2 n=1 Tax=Rhabditophanes sp. KR3021 TaxID=114890 RepID=A0AC35UIC1_9BILA